MDLILLTLLLLLYSPMCTSTGAILREGRHLSRHIIHSYYCDSSSGDIDDRTLTGFRSILRTQIHIRFILWTSPNCKADTVKQTVSSLRSFCSHSSFEVKSTAELAAKLADDSNEGIKACHGMMTSASSPIDEEALKFLTLYFFGGIYIQLGTLVLRDMSYLHTKSFAFRTSVLETSFSTYVMGFPRMSKIPIQILQYVNNTCTPNTFSPSNLQLALGCLGGNETSSSSSAQFCNDLIMFPTYYFDPIQANDWYYVDLIEHKMNIEKKIWFYTQPAKWSVNYFFPGAYTFYMHMDAYSGVPHNNSFYSEFRRMNELCAPPQPGHP